MKKTLIIMLTLLTMAGSVSSQTGEIRGLVTDKEGQPLPGATVSWLTGSTLKGTITDEKGMYQIKPLIPGSYDLNVSFVTFHSKKVEKVVVSAEKITYANIVLIPDNLLPEVEITWEPPMVDPGVTATMKVISGEELKHSVSRNIQDKIASAAGVFQREEGGSLNIRGSRENATQYVVDGIKMMGPFSLPNSAIAEITVITGGIPAMFGDATGGVILITTKGYRK
jgi:hypothetical protein